MAFNRSSLDKESTVECFSRYLENEGKRISRAQFEKNLLAKLEDPGFLNDLEPLLAPDTGWDPGVASRWVMAEIAPLLAGAPWKGNPSQE